MKVTKISQPPFSSWSWIQEKGKSHSIIVGGVEFAQKAWQECWSIMGRGVSESRPSENRTFLKTLGCPQVTFSQVPSCAKSREDLREPEASFSTPLWAQRYSLESASRWLFINEGTKLRVLSQLYFIILYDTPFRCHLKGKGNHYLDFTKCCSSHWGANFSPKEPLSSWREENEFQRFV